MACGGAAVAVGHLAAMAFAREASPVLAVAAVVVDATPEPVKHFAIETFGIYDKVVLLAGIAVILAGLSILVGILALTHPVAGPAALLAMGVVGAAAALSRPASEPWWALPSVAGTAAAMFVFIYLYRPAAPVSEGGPGTTVDRRKLLIAGAGVGAAGVAGGLLSTAFTPDGGRPQVRLPDPASTAADHKTFTDPGIAPFHTPNADFYRVDTALTVPRLDIADYRLRIGGRVDNPLEFEYRDLLDMRLIERDLTLTCVSNQVGGTLVGNARWLGVPLEDLLALARPHEGADQVVGHSADGWTCGTPTSVCIDGRDAILAVAMNGEPLPYEHGFPVRMIVPGLYGYCSATKWLVELELSTFEDFDAYWVRRGWAPTAPVKVSSRIDTPKPLAELSAGTRTVAGVAWAQQRGIRGVRVRVDDGPWTATELAPVMGTDTWRQWRWQWDATPGRHRLEVLAVTHDDETQTAERKDTFPDGSTGRHSLVVTVR